MTHHAWRLTAQDYNCARYICQRCGCIKTTVRQFDRWPSVRYRLPSGWVSKDGTAPKCAQVQDA